MIDASTVMAFHDAQRRAWPALDAAVAAAIAAKRRPVVVAGHRVDVQCHPGRLGNATAAVDPADVMARPCRLCPAQRPPEQRTLVVDPALELLCNPAPIVPYHLTAAAVPHRPQDLRIALPHLLALARALGQAWFALYNGPGAGASIPEHLHLQAGLVDGVPAIADVASISWQPAGSVAVGTRHGVGMMRLTGDDPSWLTETLLGAVAKLPNPAAVNVLSSFAPPAWTIVVVPRRRHRPRGFDATPPERLTMSPGALDVAGLVVSPVEAEFARITAGDVAGVFAEVAYAEHEVAAMLAGRG